MALQKTTLIMVGLALVLGGGITLQELHHRRNPDSQVKTQAPPHFAFPPGQIQSLTFRHEDQSLTLYRRADAPANAPQWQSDSPALKTVSQPAVDFLLALLAESRSERDFPVASDRLAEYGLSSPQTSLTIRLVNGKSQRLFLGNPDFKGDSLYALIDPPQPQPPELTVHLVSRTLEELIRRSPSDWQVPSPQEPSPVPSAP
jgi:hypothetical protein